MKTHAPPAARLRWPQVHAFRLGRHHLLRRAKKQDLVKVAGAIGGAQAQVMSIAEMQLAVRVKCSTREVREALWKDKTLVKTWVMRGTLHLIPAADLPLYSAALRTKWMKPRPSWLKFYELSEAELEEFASVIGQALTDKPMTREEVIAVAADGRSPRIRHWLRSGWGGLLKPVARRGLLCFGPSRGNSVTFVQPRQWLGAWREIDPDLALVEVARRYLRTFGPATKSDFARWWGLSSGGAAAAAWTALADDLAVVDVEGTRMQILAEDLQTISTVQVEPSVQLLPSFDPYLMGHASRDHLFDRVYAPRVSRIAGWISAVVLVDGRVEGTWTHAVSDRTLRIVIEPFGRFAPRVKAAVEARAESLAEAMGLTSVDVRSSSARVARRARA